jgi:hypothetical protein
MRFVNVRRAAGLESPLAPEPCEPTVAELVETTTVGNESRGDRGQDRGESA